MAADKTLVNRVAESGLLTIDMADIIPKEDRVGFDIKDYLFQGLILKEKDFRESLKSINWDNYANKFVGVHCSADAIIPHWAWMLIASYLEPIAKLVVLGDVETVEAVVVKQSLQSFNTLDYKDKKVVIKGCGEKHVPAAAYLEITRLLQSVVASLMYGEPCSTVPIYKRKTKS